MSPPILDAVTAVLLHDGDLYMVRRNPALVSFPGYHAFPGGKVDPEDAEGPAFDDPLLSTHDPRLMRALVRELREELGFDLPAAIAAGLVTRVDACGRAVTPAAIPRRFDTRFYHVHLRERPRFELDAREAVDSEWAPASEWMRRYHAGDMIVAPPTRASLIALAEHLDCSAVDILQTARFDERHVVLESVYGVRHLFVPSNTLPPAENTNCFVIGDAGQSRLAVDPSPRDEAEFEKLSATLQGLGVTGLLLTHHHPDHRQFADRIARRHGWPVLMSRITAQRIARIEPAFVRDLQIQHVGEGDTVTRWLGHRVQILAIPGHDDGHLALMPENRAWCIVGDLIQGVGTVVIARPEGNMREYFESMDRVIALAPKVIFPSHGVGMGTTHRLEETMRHRRAREARILELHRAGGDVEQILASIYTDIDSRLLPYARMNIEGHLDKLREEGLVAG